MHKIVVTGPESTGKSALSAALARHYQTLWVPEFAREFLGDLNRPYQQNDLVDILIGQQQAEAEMEGLVNNLLICDTDIQTIRIWSEFKYGTCDPQIIEASLKAKPDLYLLCDIDLPWAIDPLREHPHQREELMAAYLQLLSELEVPFEVIRGHDEQRLLNAIDRINRSGILAK